MDCKQTRESLMTGALDNEAGEKTRSGVEAHLRICPACQGLARDLQAAFKPLKSAQQAAVPEDLWFKIRDRIEARESFAQKLSRSFDLLGERLCGLLKAGRYVGAPVAAALVIVAIFTTRTYVDEKNLDRYLGDQVQFMEEAGAGDFSPMDFLDSI
jgi:predicted anti-sigma-YlaC factor YlaD